MKNKQIKLDLGCGNHLVKGFTGVDISNKTQAKIICDLEKYPWPWEDNSVDEMYCGHFVEHITDLFKFMDEAYRVLKKGSLFTVLGPYYTSVRAWQDPTHKRALSEPMFCYFNKAWRKLNELEHYPTKTNFDLIKIEHFTGDEWNGKSQEAMQYAAMHYWNVITDIKVTLKKI